MEQIQAGQPPSDFQEIILGKYELGRLLGRGAFAKVYHARDIRTGVSVAVKVINKNRVSSLTLISHIKREISVMRRLNHPNIVKLFEVLAKRTKIYVVMEYAKGGELITKVIKQGRFDEDLSRKYFRQLISAVSYCHSRGVYHRDIKPENLLLDENGDLKVSDFGLSAVAEQAHHDGFLRTICGTPSYVAPEILIKRGYNGGQVDIWSCGVTLFVLCAGYLPFNDANLMAMYKKIYKGQFDCPNWMSPDLKRLLTRLMDTNPKTRITVVEISNDPWFRFGYDEIKSRAQDFGVNSNKDLLHLNAFDIISFSRGLDLTGLLDRSYSAVKDSERLVVESTPDRVLKRVTEVAGEEKITMRRKEWNMELEGNDGKFNLELELCRLTDDLVVVEVRKRGGDATLFDELWKRKMRPAIVEPSEGKTFQ